VRTDYETLLVTVDGPIVEVLLNRPEKRNAISFQMVRDFNSVLAEAKYDRSVRVVTVCGAGKVFSAGHDLPDVKGIAEARERGEPHPEVDLHTSGAFPGAGIIAAADHSLPAGNFKPRMTKTFSCM
jgi:enoyl-CoA hydratase/carnithine racemase